MKIRSADTGELIDSNNQTDIMAYTMEEAESFKQKMEQYQIPFFLVYIPDKSKGFNFAYGGLHGNCLLEAVSETIENVSAGKLTIREKDF